MHNNNLHKDSCFRKKPEDRYTLLKVIQHISSVYVKTGPTSRYSNMDQWK